VSSGLEGHTLVLKHLDAGGLEGVGDLLGPIPMVVVAQHRIGGGLEAFESAMEAPQIPEAVGHVVSREADEVR
jgi:hypothetical protein